MCQLNGTMNMGLFYPHISEQIRPPDPQNDVHLVGYVGVGYLCNLHKAHFQMG